MAFSILVLSPHLANFFPKVAIFHFLRRIGYMMLFFIAFSAIKTKKDVYHCLGFFVFGVFARVVGFVAIAFSLLVGLGVLLLLLLAILFDPFFVWGFGAFGTGTAPLIF